MKPTSFNYADYEKLLAENKALRNELCQKCGRYREAHNGACNGCKWRKEDATNDKCRSNI